MDGDCGSLRVDVEYLSWILRPQGLNVPIAGTSTTNENSATSTPPVDKSQVVTIGQNVLSAITYTGFRLSVSIDPDPDRNVGGEVSGFFFPGHTNHFEPDTRSIVTFFYDTAHASGSDVPIGERALVVAGVVAGALLLGRVSVDTSTQFGGGEANILLGFVGGEYWTITGLVGFRYLSLDDTFTITTTKFFNRGYTQDNFDTQNNFYGGQIGLKLAGTGPLSLFLSTKLAAGDNQQDIDISGTSAFTPLVAGRRLPGGLFTTSANIGQTTYNQFSIVSDSQIGIKFSPCDRLSLLAAYNYMYWTNVVRPANRSSIRSIRA